MIISAW